MAAGAKLIGKEAMKGKLSNVLKNYPERVGNALYDEMGIEEKEVVKRTPELSGKLRKTVHRIGPSVQGTTIAVLIVAGGPDAPYAMIVHEDLLALHTIGQAKYLESVIMESRAFIGARVAKRLHIEDWVN